MKKTCSTCYYYRNNYCSIMRAPVKGCWADEEEALKRAKAVKDYTSINLGIRVYKKPVKEKLDERFMELYDNKMDDVQIALKLGISKSSVSFYRRSMSLPAHKKRRTAGTGAAKAK